MDKEILNKFLIEIGTLLQQAKGFTVEQLPLVAQEILTYGLYTHLMDLFLAIVFVIGGIVMIKKIHNMLIKKDWYTDPPVLLYAVPICLIITGVFSIQYDIEKIFKIKYTPRLYLIEYVSKLAK